MLEYQHQSEQEQRQTDDIKAPNIDKNNSAKTMENIVFHLKLMRGMRGDILANVVRHHVKVAHISPGYSAYLNHEEEITARASKVDANSNLKFTY